MRRIGRGVRVDAVASKRRDQFSAIRTLPSGISWVLTVRAGIALGVVMLRRWRVSIGTPVLLVLPRLLKLLRRWALLVLIVAILRRIVVQALLI